MGGARNGASSAADGPGSPFSDRQHPARPRMARKKLSSRYHGALRTGASRASNQRQRPWAHGKRWMGRTRISRCMVQQSVWLWFKCTASRLGCVWMFRVGRLGWNMRRWLGVMLLAWVAGFWNWAVRLGTSLVTGETLGGPGCSWRKYLAGGHKGLAVDLRLNLAGGHQGLSMWGM